MSSPNPIEGEYLENNIEPQHLEKDYEKQRYPPTNIKPRLPLTDREQWYSQTDRHPWLPLTDGKQRYPPTGENQRHPPRPSTYSRRQHAVVDLGGGQSLTTVRKALWGKVIHTEPGGPEKARSQLPYKHVVFLETNTKMCGNLWECSSIIKRVQEEELQTGLSDIQYNLILGGDGKVYYGRGWFEKPVLPDEFKGIADQALSIGFIGKFKSRNPPFSMMYTALNIIKLGLKRKFIAPTFKLHQLKKIGKKY